MFGFLPLPFLMVKYIEGVFSLFGALMIYSESVKVYTLLVTHKINTLGIMP